MAHNDGADAANASSSQGSQTLQRAHLERGGCFVGRSPAVILWVRREIATAGGTRLRQFERRRLEKGGLLERRITVCLSEVVQSIRD